MLSQSLQRLSEVLIDPLAIIFVCAVIVLIWCLCRASGVSRRVVLYAGVPVLALYCVCSSPATVNPLVALLEDQYPTTTSCVESELPLVVAAGGLDSRAKRATDFQFLSNATKVRTMEAWKIAQNQRNADAEWPIVLTGGGRSGVTESATMFELLKALGIDQSVVMLEQKSWSTATSAFETAKLFRENKMGQDIRLLTSAMHMPRTVASFKSAGFSVCSISVDEQAIRGIPWYALIPQTSALNKFDLFLHEVVGLIHYKISGAT